MINHLCIDVCQLCFFDQLNYTVEQCSFSGKRTSYLLGKTIPPNPIFTPKAVKSRNGGEDSTFAVNHFALDMFGK